MNNYSSYCVRYVCILLLICSKVLFNAVLDLPILSVNSTFKLFQELFINERLFLTTLKSLDYRSFVFDIFNDIFND